MVWRPDFVQEYQHGQPGDVWVPEVVRCAIIVLDKNDVNFVKYLLGWTAGNYNNGRSIYYLESHTSLGWFAMEKFLSDNYSY